MFTIDNTQKKSGVNLNDIKSLIHTTTKQMLEDEVLDEKASTDLSSILTMRNMPKLNISLRLFVEIPDDQMPKLALKCTEEDNLSIKGDINFEIPKLSGQLTLTTEDECMSATINFLPPEIFILWKDNLKLDFFLKTLI